MSFFKNVSMRLKGKPSSSKYDVDREQAMELLGDDHVMVLDIRTPKEIAGVEPLVEDAILMDFYEDDFRERLSSLDRDATYLVV